MLSAAQPTCFLIADISGNTSYFAGVEIDHAQDIVADLVGTVVSALRPGFRLAKLEGDAAFTYAPAEKRVYSFVDATSFAVMRRERIREALAFDGDFGAAGFVELRPEPMTSPGLFQEIAALMTPPGA